MGLRFHCLRPRRLQALREHPSLNGIAWLEVLDLDAPAGSPRQRTLLVRLVRPLSSAVAFGGRNVEVEGGVRVTPVGVEWAARAGDADALRAEGRINDAERELLQAVDAGLPGALLVVRTDSEGDHSTYRLHLRGEGGPLPDFDPLLSQVDFSFKVECPTDFDCAPSDDCPTDPGTPPPIDYLAKDYASFRQLLLDRLAVTMPEWKERSPADVGVALVELLAHHGDHLSWYQDAVATEAYLGTARRRPSVRRHARLLDYAMHDGCNARVWICLQAGMGVRNVLLRREYQAGHPTRFLTRVQGSPELLSEAQYREILVERRPVVFEPLHDLRLFHTHNRITFHTWGDEECCLPRGATRATLVDGREEADRLLLRPGDVLLLEEVLGPETGAPADADPGHRHPVRLTRVVPEAQVDGEGVRTPGPLRLDELLGQPVVEIEWSPADALPFPLCLSTRVAEEGVPRLVEGVSVARGNVVLADHGRTLPAERLPDPTGNRRYRPSLKEGEVTRGVPFDPSDWAEAPVGSRRWRSASAALAQDPRGALADVRLLDGGGLEWRPRRDLLASDRFAAEFVVEEENEGTASLRFGDDVHGRIPVASVPFEAMYRVGCGPRGNVGAGAIAHLLTAPGLGVAATDPSRPAVWNPMPAAGGAAPESMEEVRHHAPMAFRTQERAITEADYAAVAQRHPEVQRAVARRLWTGSWHTIFLTVDRVGGRPVDRAFEAELVAFVQRFQLAGHDLEVEPPRFVPLDIAVRVCVEAGYFRSAVHRALLERFSSRTRPDGSRGFFHPDHFSFGDPVHLSAFVAAAMEVPGVRWVEVDPTADPPARFHRWGRAPAGEIQQGFIRIGRLEIARLDHDPNAPENGRIEFRMEGGE